MISPQEANELLKSVSKENLKALECKFATYVPSKFNEKSDMLVIKELVHLHTPIKTKDGRLVDKIPRLRFKQDYQRPFWMVQDRVQKHQPYTDKKEWEYLDKLKRYECTQADLQAAITRVQGWGNPKSSLKMLARNQYLYGCDITTPTLIKAAYQQQYPGVFTPNTVAVLDTETDVVNGDGSDPILSSITFKDKAYVAVKRDWIGNIADAEQKIIEHLNKTLAEDVKARDIKFEVQICDSMAEMVYNCIQKAHEWQPDFLTFWNMDYDMTVVCEILLKAGYDLAEVFSDPRVPPEFRYFDYKRGPTTKVKADGKIENLASYDRWHVVTAPCSFQFIDAMCVYRQIRKAKGKAASYSLGYTLETHLKRGKLYFEAGDSAAVPGTIEWHKEMQMNYKFNYIAYNVFDCVGIELLDEKTRDLQTQVSILSGYSEYSVFSSNPKRAADKLHFFCLSVGKVASCVSDQMVDDNDEFVLGMDDWIVTLATHLVENNGLHLIRQLPNVRSLVRMYVSDADITSTYPNGEIIMNLSKETTMLELAKIKGIGSDRQRLIGINLTGGPANAIEILTEVAALPPPNVMLSAFKEHLKQKEVA